MLEDDTTRSAMAPAYEAPEVVSYGTIEEWTLGRAQPIIQLSLVI